MSLLRLYSLSEAGVLNKPGKSKTKRPPSIAGNVTHPPEDEEDDDVDSGTFSSSEEEDDLGPDMDYDDPTEPDSDGEDQPEDEPEQKPAAFASKPAPPSKALQGGKPGAAVKTDSATLSALVRALDAVRTNDEDLQDWIDDAIREIERAIRSGGELTLPKFEATPSLDDVDDDRESEDEDY